VLPSPVRSAQLKRTSHRINEKMGTVLLSYAVK